MTHKDAKQNRVRIDKVKNQRGEIWIDLTSSDLIPRDFPGPVKSGNQWLREIRRA
jgi:hypothetical protein